MKKINKLICKIRGHKWKWNFPKSSYPSKAICERCRSKLKLDYGVLGYIIVDSFEGEKRTDDELINQWHR